jgi:hypothetical protein
MTYTSTHRGYTLLFATLTAAVVLNIAIFISSVSRKQYILSSTARDSLFAVYNADSAMDCAAARWLEDGFPVSGNFICNGASYPYTIATAVTPLPNGWTSASRSADIFIPFASGGEEKGCAKVTLIQGTKGGEPISVVETLGYNLGNSGECPKISPRTVERALRITYR